MFSFLFTAVCSLTDGHSIGIFGIGIVATIARFRLGAECFILRASLVTTMDCTVLQAFVLHLVCNQNSPAPDAAYTTSLNYGFDRDGIPSLHYLCIWGYHGRPLSSLLSSFIMDFLHFHAPKAPLYHHRSLAATHRLGVLVHSKRHVSYLPVET